MKVVDHEPQRWFLLEDGGAHFRDGNYNHSFLGYAWMIQLSDQEMQQYRQRGREFITWLTEDIQNSVPILQISGSCYKTRRVPDDVYERASSAIEQWKEQRGGT
jgi:hypothetical protein